MSYFTPASLAFLRGIARHNRRDWFEAHRAEYEEHVKGPLAAFVEEMDVRLRHLAPEISGDPKRSIFRIYRDVRFSKDKSPYKTHAACWFFHVEGSSKVGREAHGGGAGFYFHLQPGASLVAGGLWMPPRPALVRIRTALAADPRAFERAVLAPAVRRRYGGLSDEAVLRRAPRPWGEDHPAARWLRYRSFTLARALTDVQVTGARLTATLASDFALLLPLVRWLNTAVGLGTADAR